MHALQSVVETLAARRSEFGILLNPPASEEAIAGFEAVYQLSLPPDIKAFYQFCNGFETNDFLFQVLPLEVIVNELQEFDAGVVGQRFVLAEYLIFSDKWEVSLAPGTASGYHIVNANHGTATPLVLTHLLAEFLLRYLQGGGVFGEQGLVAWYEEVAGAC